jgi:NitT/TauT family transport system permease protein
MSTDAIDPRSLTARATVADPRRTARTRRLKILAVQVALLAAFLLAWQLLPKVGWLSERLTFLDPYFISSPTEIWRTLVDLIGGTEGSPSLWPYARSTIVASLVGTLAGTILGAGFGLLLANYRWLSDVLRPFIIGLNAVPRIALIPIIVILFGPTVKSSIFTAITVVFFVVFFNAYEGGRTVPPQALQNARMLGASSTQQMWRVRWPYVLAWTVTSLPNAVSFGLVSVVTAEILTGTVGMGRLLLESVTSVQSSLTFACVVVLSVIGVVLVALTELLQRRWLHWWGQGD